MDNGCLFENLLYIILPTITIVSLFVQFVCTFHYPWFLFGEPYAEKTKWKKLTCKIWFKRCKNKRIDDVDEMSPNLEIIELNNIEDFRNVLNDYHLPINDNILLEHPWHMAISVGSPPIMGLDRWFMKKRLGNHHFVVTKIKSVRSSHTKNKLTIDDYKLTTYEYDESWCSFPLLKTCQCCNGQVQQKERNLTDIFENRGSLFLWRSQNSATFDCVGERYEKLKDEVSWELVLNNCEHFANFLLHGKHISYQIVYVPLAKAIFARSLAGLLRGHFSTTGFLRLISMIVAHVCNAVTMFFFTAQEKYQVVWLVVAGLELFVLVLIDFLYFRQILRRSVHLPNAFIDILHSLTFFFLSTASFSLGTLAGHFHPTCDPCIMNEIFLSVAFTFFALCCVHPILAGFVDFLYHRGSRKDMKLKISYVNDDNQFDVVYDIKRVNMTSIIFGIIVIIIICLILFVSPLFVLINFNELDDIFFNDVVTNCTWFNSNSNSNAL